ncbi:MAG: hypothetical protein Q7S58_13980 [Candidatus Binatus sp.]|uniref:hypothetical protein n=1 Tax=Candidatus Binatus sp. TaxID=2811406 RepID=UPI0027192DD0|nr:hypothetical protein [Candidatus Binatus sp.]MDO8433509.1 hypothetical protein [Candidatus Binatus sp.]
MDPDQTDGGVSNLPGADVAARFAASIAAMNGAIDLFGQRQAVMPKELSWRRAWMAAESIRNVERIEEGIAVGDGLGQSAAASRAMPKSEIAAAGQSGGNAARIGKQTGMAESIARGSDRIADVAHLLRSTSMKAAMVSGWANRESGLSGGRAYAAAEDRSGGRVAIGRVGEPTALFDTAAAVAAKAIVAAPRINRAEFAEPARGRQSRTSGEPSPGISIHSAPTVIIHNGGDRGDIEHLVASALRKHREQLFDELQQEAGRRERTEY